jgi:hypothetical protein
MVFLASDAVTLTTNSISNINATDVQLELSLAETKIRQAAADELYRLLYNATIIGNPRANPRITSTLSANQLSFYNLLINAGYIVGLDLPSGYWLINWEPAGPESLVRVYSFRTIVAPGAVSVQTLAAITAYFAALHPVAHTVAVTNGFINETDFGGSSSTFYEYTIVADQGSDVTDYSAGLKANLITQGLGYNSGNCNSYRLI